MKLFFQAHHFLRTFKVFSTLSKIIALFTFFVLATGCGGGGSDFAFVKDESNTPPDTVIQTPDLTVLVHSQLTTLASSVNSGSSTTVRLQLRRDSAAGPVDWALTGQTVTFYHAGGTSRGTFGATVDAGGGLYTTTFTGSTSGTTTEIYAVVTSFGQINDTAPVTVLPGALSLSQTTITVAPASVFAGASSLVTLTTRDAMGNLMESAGSGRTVVFSNSSGTGVSTGSFSPPSDNGNGVYTSTFTGSASGTPTTISATINGSLVTSTLPTIQVLPAPPPSDLSYLTFSQVTVSAPTVAAGTSVDLILSVRVTDGMGGSIPVVTGGLNVIFFNTAGTSTGVIGATIDNGDGTYRATFTGNIAGTATTIRAIISGYGLVDDTENLQVIPGALSLAKTTVTVSPPSIFSGSTAIFKITTRDAFDNELGAAGAGRTPSFSVQAGVGLSQGTIGVPVDVGDGTYTAVFTGTVTGAAASVTGLLNATPITSTAPTVLVLSSPAPVLNSVSDRTFASGSPLTVGDTLNIDFYNVNTNDDSGMTYTCFYDTTFDGTYGQACSTLPGSSASFNTSTGVLNWVTTSALSWGAFAFRVTGTKSGLTDTKTFTVNVRQNYDLTDLRVDLDANFARDRSMPPRNSSPIVSTWTNLNISGALYNAHLCGGACSVPAWLMNSGNGWAGAGTVGSPYRLNFNATNGILDLGNGVQDPNLTISLWARFNAIASTKNGTVVMTNSAGTGNGFTLKQSKVLQGRLVLLTGLENEYSQIILDEMGSSLQGYWRMSDSAGTSPLYDSCISCNQGLTVENTNRITYKGGGTAVNEPGDFSHRFNNASGDTWVYTDMGSKLAPSDYSFEVWIYTDNGYSNGGPILLTGNVGNGESGNCSRALFMNASGTVTYQVWSDVDISGALGAAHRVRLTSASALNNAQWHHIVVTHRVSTDSTVRRVRMYVNGVETGNSSDVVGLYNQGDANRFFKLALENNDGSPAGYNSNATCIGYPNANFRAWIDDVSVYTRVLTADEIRMRYRVGKKGVCRVGPIADNLWYHIGVAFSGGKSRLYLARPGTDANNSVADCSIDAGSLMVGSSSGDSNLFIGGRSDGTALWNGSIADIKVYENDFSDSSSRIESVYQSTRPRFP